MQRKLSLYIIKWDLGFNVNKEYDLMPCTLEGFGSEVLVRMITRSDKEESHFTRCF